MRASTRPLDVGLLVGDAATNAEQGDPPVGLADRGAALQWIC